MDKKKDDPDVANAKRILLSILSPLKKEGASPSPLYECLSCGGNRFGVKGDCPLCGSSNIREANASKTEAV